MYELWLVLPRYRINPHKHPGDNFNVIHIFSDCTLYRIKNGVEKVTRIHPFQNFLKSIDIDGDDIHWFETYKFPLLFINKYKLKTTNPSTNFHRT